MAGTAAKIVVSERQQKLLEEFRNSRTIGTCIVQRAKIVLLGFTGMLNEDIALQVGLPRRGNARGTPGHRGIHPSKS